MQYVTHQCQYIMGYFSISYISHHSFSRLSSAGQRAHGGSSTLMFRVMVVNDLLMQFLKQKAKKVNLKPTEKCPK